MIEYFIPKETLESLGGKIPVKEFSNFNLLLNKYPGYQEKKEKKSKNKEGKFVIYDGWKYKKDDLKNSAYIYSQIKKMDIKPIEFCLKPDWRLIVGLGSESVYETSITLHHIYGFPYIPGQSVKGVIRNYVINEYFSEEFDKATKDSNYNIDNEVEKNECFRFIFGSQKQRGKVIFFDALPVTKPIIEQDVMTPHYGDYYSDNDSKQPPADYLSPTPIPFLTVKDKSFVFNFGIKKQEFKELTQKSKLADEMKEIGILEFIEKIAVQALSNYGIGAKTAVGYGYMTDKRKELPEEFRKILDEMKPEEEKKAENRQELIRKIEIEFNLNSFRELFAIWKNPEEINKQELIEELIKLLTNKANYEKLKINNQHYELINDGFKFRNYLLDDSLSKFRKNFDIGFNKVIKYGSKNKKEEWKKLMEGE